MGQAIRATIIGLGTYLPERRLTNSDLEELVDTSDEWIVSRTGMRERRMAAEGEYTSTMGVRAAEVAIAKAGCGKEAIGMVICATMTPDYITPATACLIQAELGLKAAAVDMQAACTGFVYALVQAKALVESGIYRHVLVVASEKMSAYVDYTDRNTCVLFGDGAAAAVVAANGDGFCINSACLGSDGSIHDLLYLPGGGVRHPATPAMLELRQQFFRMSGNEVFKHAVRRMGQAATECLAKDGMQGSDIRWMVPHQANVRIMDAVAKQIGFPEDRVFKTVQKYGNTSGSSIAIALTELSESEPIEEGDNILLVAFGAGLTWGALTLTKCGGVRG